MAVRRPQPEDPRDPYAKTWTYTVGIGKEAKYQILHLESGVFYSRLGIASSQERDSLINSLRYTHPVRALQPVDMLHVDSIKELRVAPTVKVIEIDHGDQVPFTLIGVNFGEELFESVQRSRTAKFRIEEGTISVWNAIQMPLGGLLLVSVIGGIFTYLIWTAVNPLAILKIGVPASTIVLDVLFVVILIQRIVSPPRAIILKSESPA